MRTDSVFWRSLRGNFESLGPGQFGLMWTSVRPMDLVTNILLPSNWIWWRFPDKGLRARFSAFALQGAKGLGYATEDDWLDALRASEFVDFRVSASGWETRPDGTVVEGESGFIDDVVKHSITLCHILEAGGLPESRTGAIEPTRMEPGPAANAAESSGKGRKRGPKTDYKVAARVAEIVARVAPDGEWRGKLDDVCEALDEEGIPFPAKWRKDRQCRCWADCLEKAIAIKVIEYRLKTAKMRSKPGPETFS
jgi:hypothetical protein